VTITAFQKNKKIKISRAREVQGSTSRVQRLPWARSYGRVRQEPPRARRRGLAEPAATTAEPPPPAFTVSPAARRAARSPQARRSKHGQATQRWRQVCRTAAARAGVALVSSILLTRYLRARGLRGRNFVGAPIRSVGGARVWRLTRADTPTGGAVSRRTTSAADTPRRRGEEMAPEDARQADALHSFPRSASLCECSLPAPRTSPTSIAKNSLQLGPCSITRARLKQREWSGAGGLRACCGTLGTSCH
jgi:hypothetical protein